jgi:hypothetical protein
MGYDQYPTKPMPDYKTLQAKGLQEIFFTGCLFLIH